MNTHFFRTSCAVLFLAAFPLAANGETTIALDIGFGIRPVSPARVTIPVGEQLRLLAPTISEVAKYVWTKNGQPIAGATASLMVIDRATRDDAGTYSCQLATPTGFVRPSQSLVLGIGPTDRLLNVSARGQVGPAGEAALIAGFVVAADSVGKKLILRAVGPSLASFGVASPLRQPVLRIFDATGRPYTNDYVYPAVVGGPTYESDLADSLARSGAFPLPPRTNDVVTMKPFLPGNYTAQVTSGDGTTGAVLLEIYEVP